MSVEIAHDAERRMLVVKGSGYHETLVTNWPIDASGIDGDVVIGRCTITQSAYDRCVWPVEHCLTLTVLTIVAEGGAWITRNIRHP